MAVTAVLTCSALSDPVVLAPERYDPRRIQNISRDSVSLSDLVSIENPTISLKAIHPNKEYLVLDTGDSFEGIIRLRTRPINGSSIRSSKKVVRAGDVIISRLRPYLRQVAFVDHALEEIASQVLVSTEFFVLRSRDSNESSAWLVPFLLSDEIQAVLGRSQEGGHHPRFNKETLSGLRVPLSIASARSDTGRTTEDYINCVRKAFIGLQAEVDKVDNMSKNG